MSREIRARRTVRRRAAVIALAMTIIALTVLLFNPKPAQTHGFPILDGAFTGDWCGPAFKGASGPDSYLPLSMPGCPLGDEFFWDDWDALFYGGGFADTMGWLVGGGPGAPLTDFEVDISLMVTTADAMAVYYAVELGPFPSTTGVPPHVQIAIDVDGPASGFPMWFDPLGAGTLPMGLAVMPPIVPDYLVTTDVVAGVGTVWEATTAPGAWTPAGVVPLSWSGPTGGPGVIEIAVPWSMFGPGPPYGLGVPAHLTLMSAHSAPFLGPSDAPMTPQDDIITEIGAGFTTSPDICPPGPPSTDCELFIGPGGGGGSQDAFLLLAYPALPDFTVTAVPPYVQACVATAGVYQVNIGTINAFAGPVSLAAGGEPAGAATSFVPNGAIAPYTSTLTVTNILSNTVGSHTLTITGTWMSTAHTTSVGLEVIDVPPAISLTGPANGALGVSTTPTFTWQAETTALNYTLEVATDPAFSNIVVSVSGISGTSYTPTTALASGTTHFWRVRGHNSCGPGTYSGTWRFTTAWNVYLPAVVQPE